MKKFKSLLFLCALAACVSSCQKADSEQPWGSTLIYMPQANYNPYVVPNSGTAQQTNKNYSVDKSTGKVKIFLGVYRAGLEELESYSVTVIAASTALDGTTLLPSVKYNLPATVTCPDGKRDASFYLVVDLAFLSANPGTNYSLPVTISNPTRYALHEKLITTQVKINTLELLTKEGLVVD